METDLHQPSPNYWLKDTFVEDLEALTTIDNRNRFIGLQTKTPSCLIDANGMIKANDLFATCNLTAGSNITAIHNVAACNVVATNDMNSYNVVATNVVEGKVISVGSNIFINGFSLHEPCPGDANEWIDLLPFQDDEVGFIHESWIIKPRTAASVLSDLWDIADGIVDWAEKLKTLYDMFMPDVEIPTIYWDWDKIKNRPIASKGEHIGFNDDMFVSDEAKMKVCPESKFMTNELTGILDFNFITDNLPVDPSGDTIIDFGKREMTMSNYNAWEHYETTSSNNVEGEWVTSTKKEERHANLTPQGITLSNVPVFNVGDWWFSSNVVGNSNSPSSGIEFKPNFLETTFQTINTQSQFFPSDAKTSYINQYEDVLEFYTQDSLYNNNGEVAPKKIQFSVDSNGTLYARSNILMQDAAIIRSYIGETMDEPYKEGLLKISPTNVMFSKQEKIAGTTTLDESWWSLNSNGMFLAKKAAIFGKTESFYSDAFLGTSFSSYPRFELAVEDGLRYGYGASNNPMGGTYDVFKVGYKGQISTLNHNNMLMREIVNDKAEVTAPIKVGSLAVGTDGTLTIGKLKINPVGCVYMNFGNGYEMIISTIRQFKADGQSKAYTSSAFKL
jgi:hypothetical protein